MNLSVVVGASLTGERDVTGLLAAASRGDSAQPKRNPFWLFSRQSERSDRPEDRVAAELLGRKESSLNFEGDPFVDFDRIMVAILAERSGIPLKEAFSQTRVRQPAPDELVFPAPALLREHLDRELDNPERKALVLIGERQVGKSTTARLLAHWAMIRANEPVRVKGYSGATECLAAAEAIATGGESVELADFLIFDDPFEHDPTSDASSAFETAVSAILDRENPPHVVITSSPSRWQRAMQAEPRLSELTAQVTAKPTDWYDSADLAALADGLDCRWPAMATRSVLEGVASTPSRLRSYVVGKYPPGEDDVIEDKLALLRALDDKPQKLLALIRFCELARTVVPQVELAAELERSLSEIPAIVRLMLRESELLEEPHLQFAHHTDRIAFDRLYLEKQKSLRSHVLERAYGRNVVDEVCNVWLAITSVRNDELKPLEQLSEKELLEWGTLLLEEASNGKDSRARVERVLKRLLALDDKRDFWALRELVYEVVRLWPKLHSSETARDFIGDVLVEDRRMGRYCLLEALLYFQGATHSALWDRDCLLGELWDLVTAARWTLIRDIEAHGDELALIFDAMAWATPPIGRRRLCAWLGPVVDALEAEERFRGAIALACLYHPAGVELLRLVERDSPLANIGNLNEEQMEKAAELVRWHYIHQSRGRALLTRRRLEPASPDLLRRQANPQTVPKLEAETIKKFVQRMADFPHLRGWAIHLGFNLRCTVGEFKDGFLGPLVENAELQDLGLATAALTYWIPAGAHDQVQRYFAEDVNRKLLLDTMRDGHAVDGITTYTEGRLRPPRFMAGRMPHEVHMQLNTTWRGSLRQVHPTPVAADFPREVQRILVEASKEGFVDEESMWELLRHVQAGDLRPLDEARARGSWKKKELANWLRSRDHLTSVVISATLDIWEQTLA